MKKIIFLMNFHKLSKHLCIMKSRMHQNRHLKEKILNKIEKKIKGA